MMFSDAQTKNIYLPILPIEIINSEMGRISKYKS